MVGTHKVSPDKFCETYDSMVWNSDSKELKIEKRTRHALEAESPSNESEK